MLGLAHDEWDTVADLLHSSPVSLDELHDPKRVWSLGSDNPAELAAEISRLRAELGTFREALSRPFPVAVLHWPQEELAELLAGYPTLADEYPSHADHLATIEGSLRELAASGTPNLGIVTGTVPSYEAFAASEMASPRGDGTAAAVCDDAGGEGAGCGVAAAAGGWVLVWVGAGVWGVSRGVAATRAHFSPVEVPPLSGRHSRPGRPPSSEGHAGR